MRAFQHIDELNEVLGSHLGYSHWYTVTQQEIDQFAGATGDQQWIHVDADRAARGPFATTVAHGYLTLALVPTLVRDIYTVEGLSMAINYGSNRIRFPAPVPVGSRLRAGIELFALDRGSTGTLLTSKVTIECEGASKPACVAETVTLLVP